MDAEEYLGLLNSGATIEAGSAAHMFMHGASREAMRITAEINGGYHEPEELRELFSRLIGKSVDESFGLFPPFYTDYGRNITVGKRVFINMCCCFQDQGGVYIGDDCLIGHRVVFATLDHSLAPYRRGDLRPAPIRLGDRVWVGSGAVILKGVTIGDGAVVAAGSVVTKDVPANTIVAGVPARVIRALTEEELSAR